MHQCLTICETWTPLSLQARRLSREQSHENQRREIEQAISEMERTRGGDAPRAGEGLALSVALPEEAAWVDVAAACAREAITSPAAVRHVHALSLDNHRLTRVPDVVQMFLRVTSLSLSNNRLTTIPPWLSSLRFLEHLALNRNPLTALPPSLALLTALHRMDVADLPRLAFPPPHIVALCTPARGAGACVDPAPVRAFLQLAQHGSPTP